MGIVKSPEKAGSKAVSASQKLELWGYNANLVFRDGENIDVDLLNDNRTLIHTGKFWKKTKTRFKWHRWTELFVLLFDNYLALNGHPIVVLTKPMEEDGVTKYRVCQRPIPLDLLSLGRFANPPIPRGCRLSSSNHDTRMVYPCAIHHYGMFNGRFGGVHALFAESAQERLEWKAKLEEAIRLRKIVREANKVFELEILNVDTSFASTHVANVESLYDEGDIAEKVTCAVPFDTPDGHSLVAIGCAEGVWVGSRNDSQFVRMLHIPMVTQCAVLEDFGFFLVLADKALYAYHIEALVPWSSYAASASQTPRRLSRSNNVEFFAPGTVGGRTLVIYVKKKQYDSVFRVLEPVVGETARGGTGVAAHPPLGSNFNLWSRQHEWFRVYRDFFLACGSHDLLFLKARVVILCNRGFEVMDLSDFKSVTIPQKDDRRLRKIVKRVKSCKPMGMFGLDGSEFLLCYNEFGLYVDNHGDPSRTSIVEWEGRMERVVRYPPYILLFNSRFIEVRHAKSGSLVQIISGHNIGCIWDDRGMNQSRRIPAGSGMVSQDLRVYGTMDVGAARPDKRGTPATQRVFELVPRVPVYLTGSLASPPRASYFERPDSPPPPVPPKPWVTDGRGHPSTPSPP